jgi:hypothetical protein
MAERQTARRSRRIPAAEQSFGDRCVQVGALIFGQRNEQAQQAMENLLRNAAASALSSQWPAWYETYLAAWRKLEGVAGEGLELPESNALGELRRRVREAGFANSRAFLEQVVAPLLGWQQALVDLSRSAHGVPADQRAFVQANARKLQRLLSNACVAACMEDAMGG